MINAKNEKHAKVRTEVLTLPNIITLMRILIIPVFVWSYLSEKLVLSLILVIFSGVSDKLDGTLARRMNLVSAVGKWLDPLADKLTQATLAILMYVKFQQSTDAWIRTSAVLFLFFLGKEVVMILFAGLMLLLKLRVVPAAFFGKLATVLFYVVMILLFLIGPDAGVFSRYFKLPSVVVVGLLSLSFLATLIAFVSYIPSTIRAFREKKQEAS